MKTACVIVTMGTRPAELERSVASVLAQTASTEPIVVDNGALIEPIPGARLVRLPENLGPTGARNRAVEEIDADLIFFLDDDASFAESDLVERTVGLFEQNTDLGIVSFRIDDPLGGRFQRRHVPRIRTGDRTRSSRVTAFLEGACAIRRAVFDQAGLYPEEFFFGHEGIDLAWRALDAGFTIRYAGDLVVHHPATPPTRHGDFHYLTARNRVFLARRRLPALVAVAYLGTWMSLGLWRARSQRARKDLLRGFRDGLRQPCGERKPIKWRTVWKMTLLGRPPII